MDKLSLLPAELLLQILTYIPPSTLQPLSRTSPFFAHFLTKHSATISNNLLLTHYPLATKILQSKHTSSGWLIPTHPLILETESRIQRERILDSKCRCYECRKSLYATESNSSLDLAEMNVLGLPCLPRISSVCKLRESGGKDAGMSLSEPGPQYLAFLEKYARFIEVRWEMDFGAKRNDVKTEVEGFDPERTLVGEEEVGRDEEVEEGFKFWVGNFCVRRFLGSVEREVEDMKEQQEDRDGDEGKEEKVSKKWIPWKKERKEVIIGQRISTETQKEKGLIRILSWKRKSFSSHTSRSQESVTGNQSPRLMFGEISPVSEKVVSVPVEKKVGLVESMMWYGPFRESLFSQTKEEKEDRTVVDEKIPAKKTRKCTTQFKDGVKSIKRRMGKVFGKCTCRCIGGFQSLDD